METLGLRLRGLDRSRSRCRHWRGLVTLTSHIWTIHFNIGVLVCIRRHLNMHRALPCLSLSPSYTHSQLSQSNKKYNECNDGRRLERHDSLLFTSHSWPDTIESLLYLHTRIFTLSSLHTHTHRSKDIQCISLSLPHSYIL